MLNQFQMGADLADQVTRMVTGAGGESITDIYIQPGLPFRGRIASQEWIEIKDPDNPDRPVIYSHERFDAAMAAFFARDEERANNKWREEVTASGGCAFPVFKMTVIETLPALGEDTMPRSVERQYRVRGTLQKQNGGEYGLMLRCLREVPESLEAIGLPIAVEHLLEQRSGLILVTGPTGAGKSTTIAAMVNRINSTRAANIVMIEDPVEYLHEPKKGVVITREVGTDVKSYEKGVEQVLRFVPDVIGIGEIRDAGTLRAAIRAGESGHLVIATMHAPTTVAAIRKAMGYLDSPGEQIAFSGCLVGIIAQALIPKKRGGKALAYEILDARMTGDRDAIQHSVQNMIGDIVSGKGEEPYTLMSNELREGRGGGPHSSHFSISLESLVKSGEVDATRAAAVASDRQTAQRLLAMR